MQFRVSKWWRFISLLLLCLVLALAAISRKYLSLYATRKPGPAKAGDDIIRDPQSSRDPEILLAEANRIAWLSNWPKADSIPSPPLEGGPRQGQLHISWGRSNGKREQKAN